MAASARIDWTGIFKQAIVAGVVGAITIDLYLYLTTVLPAHGSMIGLWQWVASGVVGPVATSTVAYAWLGLLIHVIVSMGWAGGYAYLTRSQPFLNERWLVSGLFYGLMVYVFMQLILLGAHLFTFPDNADVVVNVVVAHTVFFGLPVAFVVAKTDGR
jgi:hypothetical protein